MSIIYIWIELVFFQAKNWMHCWIVLRWHSAKNPGIHSRIIRRITTRRSAFAFIQRNWWSKSGLIATAFTGDKVDTWCELMDLKNWSSRNEASNCSVHAAKTSIKKQSSPPYHWLQKSSRGAHKRQGNLRPNRLSIDLDASLLQASCLIWIFRRARWSFIRTLFAICRTELTPR
jgi:hypothetical protein